MDKEKILCICDICGTQYQMGPNRYDGKYISAYKLNACGTCYRSNHDGWNPGLEEQLREHFQTHGVEEPARNSSGLYPRD